MLAASYRPLGDSGVTPWVDNGDHPGEREFKVGDTEEIDDGTDYWHGAKGVVTAVPSPGEIYYYVDATTADGTFRPHGGWTVRYLKHAAPEVNALKAEH